MMGEACYEATNITGKKPVKTLHFRSRLNCTTQQSRLVGLSRRRNQFNPGIAAWLLDHPIRSAPSFIRRPSQPKQHRDFHQTERRLTSHRSGDMAQARKKVV